MIYHADSTCNDTVFTDDRTTCYCATSTNNRIGTHMYIVGNLYLIINFDTIFNMSVIKCAAINAGTRTYFNIITKYDSA